jgi:hypothetical protein
MRKEGNLNPVGLDGVFEAYCPPYYKSMDDAVDTFVEKVGGLASPIGPDYNGVLPFDPDYRRNNRPQYTRPPDAHIAMLKSYCNYVYDTYGRIPATFNAKVIPIWLQVHHIDIDFYEKHYAEGIITEAHRNHMELWHK